MIYNWHESIWQKISEPENWAHQPNAYLLIGKENTGKTQFAYHLANALLCENLNHLNYKNNYKNQACGECPSCLLFQNQTHPDCYIITPDNSNLSHSSENSDNNNNRKLLNIKIDSIREVLEPLNQSSIRGGRRVVLVYPAESLNIQAANALLKILEEPPQAVVFILISHNKDKVLPTIKSRCRQIVLPAPDFETALNFLKNQDINNNLNNSNLDNLKNLLSFHSGAPLFKHNPEQDLLRDKLLNLLSEPRLLGILDFAAEFDKQKYALGILLDWIHKWLIDLGLSQQNIPALYYPHYQINLDKIAQKTNPATLFRLIQDLNRLSPYGYHSLNVKMQAEFILCEYLNFTQNKN